MSGPGGGAGPGPAARHRRGPLESLRDNLEAIGFALVLALLLRHFAIEVFKIPTPSMEPTLWGDSPSGDPGDRVLVDKAAYLFRDPARWDVIVFRYPLDWNRNFIKRIVGRPDEGLRIERGDVWVGPWKGAETVLHPARKPRRVREQLYVPFYPPAPGTEGPPADWWRERSPGAGSFHAEGHGRLVYEGDRPGGAEPEPAVLEYGYPIRSTDRIGQDPRSPAGDWYLVPDLRARCTVEARGPAEVELSWSPGDGRRHVLRLASEGRLPSAVRTASASYPLRDALPVGRPVELELESVDGDLRAYVDGREARVVPDELTLEDAVRYEDLGEAGPKPSLTVSARGAPLEVRDLRLDHDLYYTNYRSDGSAVPRADETFHVGPDQYFMLGDNTTRSSDSRRWTANGVRLKDGTEILWDWQSTWRYVEEGGRRLKEVSDVEGVARRWAADDEDQSLSRRMSTVSRDRIVGRAWFALVFWPLDRALSRVRFVR